MGKSEDAGEERRGLRVSGKGWGRREKGGGGGVREMDRGETGWGWRWREGDWGKEGWRSRGRRNGLGSRGRGKIGGDREGREKH